MQTGFGRRALRAWPLAGWLLASASGGCAGAPFSSPSDAGAGGTATGGASLGGSSSGGTAGRSTGGAAGSGGRTGGTTGGGTAQGGRGGSSGAAGKGGASGGAAPTGGSDVGGAATTGGALAGTEIPQDGLVLWLAADRGVVETNGAVSKWLDQSGLHNDASQVASAARPKRVSQNGSTMLEFDGSDDSLALPEGFDDFSTGVSFFSVVHLLKDNYCQAVLQLSNGPEIDDIDFGRFMGSVHYEVASNFLTGSTDAYEIEKTTLVDYVHDADERVELRMDGQFMISGSFPLPAVIPRVGNFVGRSLYTECQPLSARVGEIVLYARPLGSEERVRVEEYLGKKWGCCSI